MTEEEQLIEEVRQHKSLYDINSIDYRDQNIRREAWEEIGSNLKITADECKTKWNKLRNCFMNAIRRRRSKKSGQATKEIPPWKFSKQMEFLLPFLENKETYSNVVQEESTSEPSETAGDEPIDETLDETVNDALDESASETSVAVQSVPAGTSHSRETPLDRSYPPSKKKKPDPVTEMVTIMKENASLRKQKQQGKGLHLGEIEMFYMSMAKIASRLPKIEEAKLRQKVCSLVSEAEIKHLESESWSGTTSRASQSPYRSGPPSHPENQYWQQCEQNDYFQM